jgi:hypothetical protein
MTLTGPASRLFRDVTSSQPYCACQKGIVFPVLRCLERENRAGSKSIGPPARPDQYAVDDQNRLYQIDPATGAATLVEPTGIPGVEIFVKIAVPVKDPALGPRDVSEEFPKNFQFLCFSLLRNSFLNALELEKNYCACQKGIVFPVLRCLERENRAGSKSQRGHARLPTGTMDVPIVKRECRC